MPHHIKNADVTLAPDGTSVSMQVEVMSGQQQLDEGQFCVKGEPNWLAVPRSPLQDSLDPRQQSQQPVRLLVHATAADCLTHSSRPPSRRARAHATQ